MWEEQFHNFWRPIGPHADRNDGQAKVAVLDTGVDVSVLTEHVEKIKGRKCFLVDANTDGSHGGDDDTDDDDDDDDDEEVLDLDPNRHGSHIAKLIMTLAPCAHIYVARVKKDHTSPVDPGAVAKVIITPSFS